MTVVWTVNPKKGLGPLEFGMTRADIAQFQQILGPLEEAKEDTMPNGRMAITEFRHRDSPLCSFEDGVLTRISIHECDNIDMKFQDISIFKDDPKQVYSALGRAAGAVYWLRNSVVMPDLCLELAGFVIEYSPKGKPPIFVSKKTAFTWPQLVLFPPGHEWFEHRDLIEISNEAK